MTNESSACPDTVSGYAYPIEAGLMCAACGQAGHIPVVEPAPVEPSAGAVAAPRKFAALRNRDCRPYLIGGALAMMADNIEHVITYWVLWQKFHSEALVGFQVISHWLPFLFLSVYFGGLADRFDCRRVIQAGQALFMIVSLSWGVLFLTDSLQVWEACVLLVLHGMAGAMWSPAEQLMLHDFVEPGDLPSAVRLNATFKSLGVLFGPVVGSVLLLGLGPTYGIFVNAAIYLPLTLFLFVTHFTGHLRDGDAPRPRIGVRDAVRTLREVRSNHTMLSMIILAGLGSFFIGASLQAAMPEFASQVGGGSAGGTYGALLFATGAGGVLGGIALETSGRIPTTVKAAVVATAVYGLAILGFALTHTYLLALALLFIAGVANLTSMSTGQTVVQLEAPADQRGRIIGVYGMSAQGLRVGSGVTVGLFGAVVGVRSSLGLSAAVLCLGTAITAIYALRRSSR